MSLRLRGLLGLALLLSTLSSRAADEVVVRTSTIPETALVGQRVILRVEVLGRDGWAQIKRSDDFAVGGAFVMKTQTQGTRIQEQIAGHEYTGQRYELSIYPQRAGKILVPEVEAEVLVTTWGGNAGKQVHKASVPGLSFMAEYPPGAGGIRGLISTNDLTGSQSWEPKTETVMVGDALRRTFSFKASNVPGMAFLPVEYPDIEGVAIYQEEPVVEDKVDRGSILGQRQESVTYVFEEPGDFSIPPLDLYWWDMKETILKRIELSGLSVRVEPNPAIAVHEFGGPVPEGSRGWSRWLALAALLAGAGLGFAFRQSLARLWVEWLEARRMSEKYQFRAILQAIQTGNRDSVIRETMHWLDRIGDGGEPARLEGFLTRFGSPELCSLGIQVAAMDETPVDLALFGKGLKEARQHWRQEGRSSKRRRAAGASLPDLNKFQD
jgi:hypothetical protein